MDENKYDTNKKTTFRILLDQSLMDNAEEILDNLGITPTAAITMLFR